MKIWSTLLFCLSTAVFAKTVTIAWDASPSWPIGTTVEVTANGITQSGITGSSTQMELPNGVPTEVKARAIPPIGYQCGEPLADCPPSDWAMISALIPSDQANVNTYRQIHQGSPMAAVQVQKKKYAAASASTSHSVVLDATPTQGNLLILAVVGDAIVNTPSGWTQAVDSVNWTDTGIYYKTSGAGESATITATLMSSSKAVLFAYEYSGMTNALDKTASATSSASTIASGTTATTTSNDQLLVALFGINQAGNTTVTSYSNSFVQDDFADSGNTGSDVAGYVAMRTVSSTGAYSTTATLSVVQSGNSGVIATFPIASAPAASLPISSLQRFYSNLLGH